jgi:hypothetical protein
MSFDVAGPKLREDANQLLVNAYERVRKLAVRAETVFEGLEKDPTTPTSDLVEADKKRKDLTADARCALGRVQALGALNDNPSLSMVGECRAYLYDLREEFGLNPLHAQRELTK